MSHSKERAEKICLNCSAALTGRYCQVCGQENIEPKETVLGLVSHFFNDITHFDGKFFSTVKLLLVKPGFLSAEYIKGRRASYLHPIRMYVFTSAFFFIIFFSLFNVSEIMKGKEDNEEALKEYTDASSSLKEHLPTIKDSVLKVATLGAIAGIENKVQVLAQKVAEEKAKDSLALLKARKKTDTAGIKIPGLTDSVHVNQKTKQQGNDEDDNEVEISPNTSFSIQKFSYRSQIAYDSVQARLPASSQDGWFSRYMAKHTMKLNSKWKDDRKETVSLFAEKFMHTLPQGLFVSLPIFALLLLMLYARRNFYYVDHSIFAIHVYCANFIILIVYFAFDKLEKTIHGGIFSFIEGFIVLGMFFYLYKAMRRFYGQKRFKTILKFLLLLFSCLIVFVLLAGLFVFLSVIQFS